MQSGGELLWNIFLAEVQRVNLKLELDEQEALTWELLESICRLFCL